MFFMEVVSNGVVQVKIFQEIRTIKKKDGYFNTLVKMFIEQINFKIEVENEKKIKKRNIIFFIDNLVKKKRGSTFSNNTRLINKTAIGIDVLPFEMKDNRDYLVEDILKINLKYVFDTLERSRGYFEYVKKGEVRIKMFNEHFLFLIEQRNVH